MILPAKYSLAISSFLVTKPLLDEWHEKDQDKQDQEYERDGAFNQYEQGTMGHGHRLAERALEQRT